MKQRQLFIWTFCGLLAQVYAGDKKESASAWRANEIVIDGAEHEWARAFSYLEKEKIAYAIKNDTSHFKMWLLVKLATDLPQNQ